VEKNELCFHQTELMLAYKVTQSYQNWKGQKIGGRGRCQKYWL